MLCAYSTLICFWHGQIEQVILKNNNPFFLLNNFPETSYWVFYYTLFCSPFHYSLELNESQSGSNYRPGTYRVEEEFPSIIALMP